MKNLENLTNKEIKDINGGNWIFDLFFALGSGAVQSTETSCDPGRIAPHWTDKM